MKVLTQDAGCITCAWHKG